MATESGMSSADELDRVRRERRVLCPHCGTRAPWAGNPNRPFCSVTCRLIDLGEWLDERYRIAGPRQPDDGLEGE